jgi:hypothetical protein
MLTKRVLDPTATKKAVARTGGPVDSDLRGGRPQPRTTMTKRRRGWPTHDSDSGANLLAGRAGSGSVTTTMAGGTPKGGNRDSKQDRGYGDKHLATGATTNDKTLPREGDTSTRADNTSSTRLPSHASRQQADPVTRGPDSTSSGATKHGSDGERAWAGGEGQTMDKDTTRHTELQRDKGRLWLEAGLADPAPGRPDPTKVIGERAVGTGGGGVGAWRPWWRRGLWHGVGEPRAG